MFKQIVGSLKWLTVTAGAILATMAVDNPIAQLVGILVSGGLSAGTLAVVIPNDYWKFIFVFIGKTITTLGNKHAPTKYEDIEDIYQSGSIRVFIIQAMDWIDEGMDFDDME